MCMVIIHICVFFITEIIESVSASKVRYEKIVVGVGPGSIRNINEVSAQSWMSESRKGEMN